ncbi:PREDICTED: pleckstrin homology domain-containing family B member 1-like, partial [Gekko japonicus]|uniref:Pleckstrin homology domain-containing family B member 1-like n=1 Tax=Gekko japonicus TaxID=146911 RepID=A0ABM1LAE5_GEKJA
DQLEEANRAFGCGSRFPALPALFEFRRVFRASLGQLPEPGPAWKMAMLEAKATQVHLYDPYNDDYYQTVPLDSHQAMYVSSDYYGNQFGAPGMTHVIIREDPYRVSGDQMALGLLAGAATGAALGSFMWMPCWF